MLIRLILLLIVMSSGTNMVHASGCVSPRTDLSISRFAERIYKGSESIAVVRVIAVRQKGANGEATIRVVEALKGIVPQEVTFSRNRLVNGPELHAGETRLLALNGNHVAPCLSRMFSFPENTVVDELKKFRRGRENSAL